MQLSTDEPWDTMKIQIPKYVFFSICLLLTSTLSPYFAKAQSHSSDRILFHDYEWKGMQYEGSRSNHQLTCCGEEAGQRGQGE